MIRILVVSNCPSKNTLALQRAVVQGCKNDGSIAVEIRHFEPLDANESDVKWCDGLIIGSTENFGYMSGLIKDFFERIYYPCLEETEGKPVALFIKGGLDGTGAKNSIEKIIAGLRWKFVLPCLVLKGDFQTSFLDACQELGHTLVAGLDAGIY